jgi:hypothetical protein
MDFYFLVLAKTKRPPKWWHKHLFRKTTFKIYMISSAFANHVHTKGSVKMQTPPIYLYSTKKAATDKRKRTQYKPVDFFASSIVKSLHENRAKASISKSREQTIQFLNFLISAISMILIPSTGFLIANSSAFSICAK